MSHVALAILLDDPLSPDVASLIASHLAFARGETPSCHVFALPTEALRGEDIELYSCRDDERLLAIGAVRRIGDDHFEIKSMHTAQHARGAGVGRMMLEHLISVATRHGAARVSLETGTSPGFAPARRLYETSGFVTCEPFADYPYSPDNVCMTRKL